MLIFILGEIGLCVDMARRRAKKTVNKSASSPLNGGNGAVATEAQIEKDEVAFTDQEIERQSSAIRAIRDVEIEHLLTELRLLRSYFSKEQLQSPALQFFKENLPNLSVVGNEGNRQFEVQWNYENSNLYMNPNDGIDLHASILRRLSMVYPDCSGATASLRGVEFSSKAVKTSLLGVGNLQIGDFEPSETQMLGMQDGLRTPGVSSQRLSVGMTPKTRRLPKPGEMLLSVHGSPLGVYKEDNMEAIHESEEG
ncbi:hypothetical protein F2P56_022146 [Juglans regia]|uniref:Uncharacterized protein n=2 Tax=Juglans regia TaxID=51240 RepID=A0A833UTN7_JUGRE|nr:uncharacterized protein LOC109004133 isoform X3 [Juglans regia]KAF5458084.1 hypothetical protein F2P56_022146 [Juglans regia]